MTDETDVRAKIKAFVIDIIKASKGGDAKARIMLTMIKALKNWDWENGKAKS